MKAVKRLFGGLNYSSKRYFLTFENALWYKSACRSQLRLLSFSYKNTTTNRKKDFTITFLNTRSNVFLKLSAIPLGLPQQSRLKNSHTDTMRCGNSTYVGRGVGASWNNSVEEEINHDNRILAGRKIKVIGSYSISWCWNKLNFDQISADLNPNFVPVYDWTRCTILIKVLVFPRCLTFVNFGVFGWIKQLLFLLSSWQQSFRP